MEDSDKMGEVIDRVGTETGAAILFTWIHLCPRYFKCRQRVILWTDVFKANETFHRQPDGIVALSQPCLSKRSRRNLNTVQIHGPQSISCCPAPCSRPRWINAQRFKHIVERRHARWQISKMQARIRSQTSPRRTRNWYWHVPTGHNFPRSGKLRVTVRRIFEKFRKSPFERECRVPFCQK